MATRRRWLLGSFIPGSRFGRGAGGILVDQAVILQYLIGYMAVALAAFVLLLPIIVSLLLLLLLAGVAQLMSSIVYRLAVRLFRAVADAFKEHGRAAWHRPDT
ncbi:hypothetical protein [Arthrobacter sp. ISL-30]|uniref:hypothetical protein n=1 Tax=Arthrobacter sp. ISL-30 TaxID=2819109 RepID=UPI001BE7DEED|nr:hypothetical protein [Arthrobacter sp. ISL-30]MBT2515795.1 hypothetical protein [Arthrobacter sp. ISL-30]